MEAMRRANEGRGGGYATLYGPGGPDQMPEEQEGSTRIWIQLPSRARSESHHPGGPGQPNWEHIIVHDGETFWSYDPHNGAMTNGGDKGHQAGIGVEAHILDAATLIASSTVELFGEAEVLGRRGLRVLLAPRLRSVLTNNNLQHLGHWIECPREVILDAERGIVLSDTLLLDGEPFARTAFTEIAFDIAIPEERLTFTPPPGEEVRNASEAFRAHQPQPLHEVAAAATFTVLSAQDVPNGWTLRTMRSEGMERPPRPESVHLHYSADDASAQVNVNERSVEATGYDDFSPDGGNWRTESRGARDYRLWEPSQEDWPMPRQVTFEDHGTRVQLMSSDHDLDVLLGFATTFTPASTEPPTLTH